MAYNRKNTLERMIEIQEIVLEMKKKEGVKQKWIYDNVIFPKYKISYSCFNSYLSKNAKKELKILLEKEEEKIKKKL